jgi:hypothetical protein
MMHGYGHRSIDFHQHTVETPSLLGQWLGLQDKRARYFHLTSLEEMIFFVSQQYFSVDGVAISTRGARLRCV